jgi:hypothetical protein
MDMQVQLEWETRIGPGMDRNWAHSICEKRGKREMNKPVHRNRLRERRELSPLRPQPACSSGRSAPASSSASSASSLARILLI